MILYIFYFFIGLVFGWFLGRKLGLKEGKRAGVLAERVSKPMRELLAGKGFVHEASQWENSLSSGKWKDIKEVEDALTRAMHGEAS